MNGNYGFAAVEALVQLIPIVLEHENPYCIDEQSGESFY